MRLNNNPIALIFLVFQSTHLREVRRVEREAFPLYRVFQSTHLREVRLVHPKSFSTSMDFNPRTCVRCDLVGIELTDEIEIFQSTHLREVRLQDDVKRKILDNFNPRTCVRCDIQFLGLSFLLQFQSTHLREVRRMRELYLCSRSEISIHAPA